MFQRTKICTSLLVAFGGTLLAAPGAFAQDANSGVQRVEITGSSIKRISSETALPVTTLSKDDIERTGATTAADLVNLIPSNFGGLSVTQNIGATGVASTANLRNLGSKYTLVLLNGRRVANYAFNNSPVDLNSIPLSAIERVEVLRDGASAVYGADAVAGVINFITRKDFTGAEISGYTTHTTQGGGNIHTLSAAGGFGDLVKDRFNVFMTAYSEYDQQLKAKDRDFAASAVVDSLGINKASPRNGIPNLNFTDSNGNQYGTGGTVPSINPYRYNGCDNPEFALVVTNATNCGTDYVKFIDLIPKQNHTNFTGRFVAQLDENNQFIVEGMRVRDHIQATYSPAPYTKTMVYPVGGRFYPTSIIVPAGTPLPAGYVMPDGTVVAADTTAASDITVTPTGPLSGTWRTVAGGGRTDLTDQTTNRLLAGFKGTLGEWDYDTAFTRTTNSGTISFGPGQFSYAKLTPLVNAGEINVFGSQDDESQALLNSALITGPEQSAASTSNVLDLRVSREIGQLAGGGIGVAFGGELRHEYLNQISYPVLASGDQVGGAGPIPSVAGSRHVDGLYFETELPFTKSFELDLAGRYDKYKNNFGTSFSAFSPKAAIRFQPLKELLFRASVGKGYRAPALFENLRPFTSGNNTAANWSDPIRCPNGVPINNTVDQDTECNVQLPSANGGDTHLSPEKSRQFALGFSFQPAGAFNATLDYWNVEIKQAIQAASEFNILNNDLENTIYRYDPTKFDASSCGEGGLGIGATANDPNAVNDPICYVFTPFANTSRFFSSGLDLSLTYKEKFGAIGLFNASLEGTYVLTHGYQYAGLPETSDAGKYLDFGPAPRWRHALNVGLVHGPFSVSMTQNFTSSYQDFTSEGEVNGTTYPETRRVKAYVTYDGLVGWKAMKGLDLNLGIKNMFNQDPPLSRTEANFQTGYDAQFTDPRGRMIYARVGYKFQ